MSQKIFLFISLLLYTGCVERGYDLTVNNNTNTITAIKSVDIRKQTTSTKADIDKMNTAVTKEQKKQPSSPIKIKKQANKLKKVDENIKHMEEKKVQAQKQLETKKKLLKEKKKLEAKKLTEDKKERDALEEKLAKEKETKRLAAQREITALQEKSRLEKETAKKKEAALLQKNKRKKRKRGYEEKTCS